jgi:hypothetical protein
MNNYRKPFVVAVGLNLLLAGGLALVWWRSNPKQARGKSAAQPQAAEDAVSAEGGGMEVGNQASDPRETPLIPVQLTPQRMQSIGVKTGVFVYRIGSPRRRWRASCTRG